MSRGDSRIARKTTQNPRLHIIAPSSEGAGVAKPRLGERLIFILSLFSPSVKTCGFDTSLVRGRKGFAVIFSSLVGDDAHIVPQNHMHTNGGIVGAGDLDSPQKFCKINGAPRSSHPTKQPLISYDLTGRCGHLPLQVR